MFGLTLQAALYVLALLLLVVGSACVLGVVILGDIEGRVDDERGQ